MSTQISKGTQGELIGALRERYRVSSKMEKTKILDEFKALTGFHRKHAIRLLKAYSVKHEFKRCYGRRIYGEAVREALVVTWEAGDRICGKRLKAVLPALVDAMERHGHLQLDPEVRRCLLAESCLARSGGCYGATWPSAARSGSAEMSFSGKRFNPGQALAADTKRS